MAVFRTSFVALAIALCALPAAAQDKDAEIAHLKAQVDDLRRENAELQKRLVAKDAELQARMKAAHERLALMRREVEEREAALHKIARKREEDLMDRLVKAARSTAEAKDEAMENEARAERGRREIEYLKKQMRALEERIRDERLKARRYFDLLPPEVKASFEAAKKTRQLIQDTLPISIETFLDEHGELPGEPAAVLQLTKQPAAPTGNATNSGAEALVLMIRVRHKQLIEMKILKTANTDKDRFGKGMEALEVVDAWGHPFVFIPASGYAKPVVVVNAKGQKVTVRALKGEDGKYVNSKTYQLMSLGPNGKQDQPGAKGYDDIVYRE